VRIEPRQRNSDMPSGARFCGARRDCRARVRRLAGDLSFQRRHAFL